MLINNRQQNGEVKFSRGKNSLYSNVKYKKNASLCQCQSVSSNSVSLGFFFSKLFTTVQNTEYKFYHYSATLQTMRNLKEKSSFSYIKL